MKKIFTLLFSLGILTSVFAQSGHHDDRDRSGNSDGSGYSQYTHVQAPDYSDHDRFDRNDNNHYDRRDADYNRGSRYNNYYEKSHIEVRREERSDNLKAVGAGLIVGGIVALLASSH